MMTWGSSMTSDPKNDRNKLESPVWRTQFKAHEYTVLVGNIMQYPQTKGTSRLTPVNLMCLYPSISIIPMKLPIFSMYIPLHPIGASQIKNRTIQNRSLINMVISIVIFILMYWQPLCNSIEITMEINGQRALNPWKNLSELGAAGSGGCWWRTIHGVMRRFPRGEVTSNRRWK